MLSFIGPEPISTILTTTAGTIGTKSVIRRRRRAEMATRELWEIYFINKPNYNKRRKEEKLSERRFTSDQIND